jgi:type III secretion system low calcium response chaperone LcrH/SycD
MSAQTDELSPEQAEALMDGLLAGLSMAEATGIQPDVLEAGYGLAGSLYNSGNFKDAETMFKALAVYDHREVRFWMGLAGCRQMNGDLDGAIEAYGMATFSENLASPGPSVHAGLCYLKKGEKENARALFDAAVELGDEADPEHMAYRERARAMLNLLKKEGTA